MKKQNQRPLTKRAQIWTNEPPADNSSSSSRLSLFPENKVLLQRFLGVVLGKQRKNSE